MNELQRMQYMDAMGVDMFVPRLLLPNASASQLCALPEVNPFRPDCATESSYKPSESLEIGGLIDSILGKAGAQKKDESHTSDRRAVPVQHSSSSEFVPPSAGAVHIQTDIAVNRDTQLKPVQAAPDTVPVKADAQVSTVHSDSAASESVSFYLSVWTLDHFLIIDSQKQGQALPTEKLLNNILRFKGLIRRPVSGAEFIKWPIVVRQDHSQTWQAARDWFAPFLEGKLFSGQRKLILLGQDAFAAATGATDAYESSLYQQTALEGVDLPVLVLPSLTDMLYQSKLKRSVWLALQAFT